MKCTQEANNCVYSEINSNITNKKTSYRKTKNYSSDFSYEASSCQTKQDNNVKLMNDNITIRRIPQRSSSSARVSHKPESYKTNSAPNTPMNQRKTYNQTPLEKTDEMKYKEGPS